MATKVEEAIAEIDDLLARFAPQHEGLRDFARLNLGERTQEWVRQSIIHYDRRILALTNAREGLVALMADGHPDLPVVEIDPISLADLQANAATIEAALTRFASNAATTLSLKGGTVASKTP